jgi:hypothetical protein
MKRKNKKGENLMMNFETKDNVSIEHDKEFDKKNQELRLHEYVTRLRSLGEKKAIEGGKN